MKKEQLRLFENILIMQRKELLGEAEKTVTGMSSKVANFPDPSDRASLETDRNFLLRVKDRERKLVIKIDEAIKRIEYGIYGECESCGEDISMERLEARPVTTFCIDCKTEEELLEKAKHT